MTKIRFLSFAMALLIVMGVFLIIPAGAASASYSIYGHWKFNDSLDFSSVTSTITENFNFYTISGSGSSTLVKYYNSIVVNASDQSVSARLYKIDEMGMSFEYPDREYETFYFESSWSSDQGIKEIYFGNTAKTVSKQFLDFMIANATILNGGYTTPEGTFSDYVVPNAITDETTISQDFYTLGLNYSDYTLYDRSNPDDLYIVGLGESYAGDGVIQTYIYFYYPAKNGDVTIKPTSISYKRNGTAYKFNLGEVEFNSNGLAKVKAFSYGYVDEAQIEITGIDYDAFYDGDKPAKGGTKVTAFRSNNKHKYENGEFSVFYEFTSTLLIKDWALVRVNVDEDDMLFDDWEELFTGKDESYDLYFYNFNFPDNIKPDEINYACFLYSYKKYESFSSYTDFDFNCGHEEYENKLIYDSGVIPHVYVQSERILKPSGGYWNSKEFTFKFDVFHLGDRRDDGQFNFTEDQIVEGNMDFFDRDCSILIDLSYRTLENNQCSKAVYMGHAPGYCGYTTTYSSIDEAQLIELHYTVDGVLVKSKVVVPPIDESEIHDVEIDMGVNPPLKDVLSDLEMILGIILLIGGVIVFVKILPYIIKIIRIPFDLIKSLFK